jgi:uncharacterized protein YqcC (DUF446 family)
MARGRGRRKPTDDALRARAGALIDRIEQQLRALGRWQAAPLPPEAYAFRQAFAADTMAFAQWLQFVFIAKVRALIAERGEFPAESSVGAMAVREFDGDDAAGELVSLLSEFDAAIEGG